MDTLPGGSSMFSAESHHNLDSKHRVFMPKRFQEHLNMNPGGHRTLILTCGFEKCLFIFKEDEFDRVRERMALKVASGLMPRKLQRMFFANTHTCQLDSSGRLVLPEKLRRHARLTKEVVMVGVDNKAEIWDKAEWADFETENGEAFAALGEIFDSPLPPSLQNPTGGGQ